MKRWLKFLCVTSYAIAAIPALAFAVPDDGGDKKKDVATSDDNSIRIQVQSSSADMDDILKKVRESLKESGLSEKAAKKVLQTVESQLDAANVLERSSEKQSKKEASDDAEGKSKRKDGEKKADKQPADVKVFGEALYIDNDGKELRLELKPQIAAGAEGMQRDVEQKMKQMMQQLQKQVEAQGGIAAPLEELLENSEAAKAPEFAIGVALTPPSDKKDEASEKGIVVESVFDDTPASAAGLEPGDKLTAIDQKEIVDFSQVREIVQEAGKADREIALTWERDGKTMEAKIKPQRVPATPELEGLGISGGPGVQLSLPRVFVTPGKEGTIESWGIDQGSIGKEMRELKKQLTAVQDELREIKELLKKQSDATK
jgi:C-terminal processing protease CtpA/Prc